MSSLKKLNDVLAKAVNYSPFYKQLYSGINIGEMSSLEELTKLPIISAEDIIEHCTEFLPTTIQPYRVTSSSGTLGKPKTIYRSESDTAVSVEVLERLLKMAGVTNRDTVFIGQPFDLAHFGYLVYDACKKMQALAIPAGISISNEQFIQLIQHYKPTVLCTSISRLLVVIDILKSLNITKLSFVKKIILAGEPIQDKGIKIIEDFFNTTPFNFYGSEETDGLAGDCEYHSGLHFFEDLFYLELLPIDGLKPSKVGNRIGEAVITSLYQTATPLIRYRLGDIVEVDVQRCKCGSTYPLIKVLGRAKDALHLFDGITLMAYQIEKVLKVHLKEVVNYQIVASTLVPGIEELCIRIETPISENEYDQVITELSNDLWNSSQDLYAAKEAGTLRFKIEINQGNIEVTQRGKTRRIIDLRISE